MVPKCGFATPSAEALARHEQRPHGKCCGLCEYSAPDLDMLEKHAFTFLSANLDPSVNELFKVLLENFNTKHKFKGKV